mmetsp:Transcript_7317/g.14590  ORF Transcript_7317/g.14590 Transcript_7317/m.14590 type:complete len:180 (-) Transcript_7317:538-1077(-)
MRARERAPEVLPEIELTGSTRISSCRARIHLNRVPPSHLGTTGPPRQGPRQRHPQGQRHGAVSCGSLAAAALAASKQASWPASASRNRLASKACISNRPEWNSNSQRLNAAQGASRKSTFVLLAPSGNKTSKQASKQAAWSSSGASKGTRARGALAESGLRGASSIADAPIVNCWTVEV